MVEFLDDDISSQFQNFQQPQANVPSGFSSSTKEITPEMLDNMINDENQHPEIRSQAKKAKEKLLSKKKSLKKKKEESPKKKEKVSKPKEKEKPKEKKQSSEKMSILNPNKPLMQYKETETPKEIVFSSDNSDQKFSNLLGSIQSELYQEEISLISDDSTTVNLRSMTVEEYKFVNQQLELFEDDIKKLSNVREKQIRELSFINSLDTVLQRCIVNQINVSDLIIYDWLFLLLALRCISRPSETNMTLTYKKDGKIETKTTEIDVPDFLNYLKENSESFSNKIIGTEKIADDYSLFIMPLIRGDMHFIEQNMKQDPNSEKSFLEIAMATKAFMQDDQTAYVMTPDKRLNLFSSIGNYDIIRNIQDKYYQNLNNFFSVVNHYFREKFGNTEAIDISDFILFFLTF